MIKTSEATLNERAGYVYRKLLLLQRLFQVSSENENADWLDAGEPARNLALCSGILEVLDDLAEQARVLTTVPFPLKEWRAGDRADDERWRALTEVERREVLSIVSCYEDLITWCESLTESPQNPSAIEHLKSERTRLARFRQEVGFLERRQISDIARINRPRSLDS